MGKLTVKAPLSAVHIGQDRKVEKRYVSNALLLVVRVMLLLQIAWGIPKPGKHGEGGFPKSCLHLFVSQVIPKLCLYFTDVIYLPSVY